MKTFFLLTGIYLSITISAGCSQIGNGTRNSPPSTPDYAVPATKDHYQQEILTVLLPQDSIHHNAPIEWWYFNGHLADVAGNEYSYHFTTFQTERDLDEAYPQLFHLSWNDHQTNTVYHAEKSYQQYRQLPEDYIDFQVSTWQMKETATHFELYFDIPQYSIELALDKNKKPVLHNGTGFVDMKQAGQTYYYTYSSLKASGQIIGPDSTKPVEGTSWMDHQWGDFLTDQEIGWDWFSLHLSSSEELMIAYVRNKETHEFITSYGTHIDKNGDSTHLHPENFNLDPKQFWTSPKTTARYPITWGLEIPSMNLKLDISAVTTDSEFSLENALVPAYWEGSIKAKGTMQDAPISGYGFMELVGY